MISTVVRLCLLACPPAFRREYGPEIVEMFETRRARLAANGASRRERLRLVRRTVVDLLRTGVGEWFERLAGGPSPVPTPTHEKRSMLDRLTREVRDAVRHLAATPGFTLTAIVMLGIGIGGTAAVFSAVDALLLRPHPFVRAHELVNVYQDSDDGRPESNAYPAYQDMAAMGVFSGIAAVMPEGTATFLPAAGDARSVSVEYATASYLPVLGLRPARGRWFAPAEDVASAPPAAVITYSAWQRRFAGDPDIVGRVVRLSGAAVPIVGVGPRGHDSSAPGLATEFWLSISALGPVGGVFRMAGLSHRDDHWFQVVGRMTSGVSIGAAQSAMNALADRLAREFPESDRGRRITVFPADRVRLHPQIDPGLFSAAGVPLALAALVLTVVCSNLANLMLARGAARRRDFAVRQALGASRGALVRALALESLVLAAAGGAAGLLLANWIVEAVGTIALPLPLPVGLAIVVDARVVIFGMLLSLATGLAFGVLPAYASTRRDLLPALKHAAAQPPSGRPRLLPDLRKALVVCQVAVSLALVACAGILVRSLINAAQVDLGFDPGSVALVTIDPEQAGRGGADARLMLSTLRERIAARPDVIATGLASRLPLTPVGPSNTLVLDAPTSSPGPDGTVEVKATVVTPGYFEAMRLPIVFGRDFASSDDARSEPVAVVSEAMGRTFWGTPDAVGRRYRHSGGSTTWVRIVGVVRDVPVESPGERPRAFVYRPFDQRGVGRATLVVRTAGDPESVLGPVREEVRSLDSQIPVLQAGTMSDHVGRSMAIPRLAATLLAGFGALAVAVSCLGVYSVVAFGVARRRNEMGIRMAVGATGRQVIRLVVGEMLTVVVAGLAAGIGLAALVTPALASLLLGIGPRDPMTFGIIAALLAGIAALAAWIPARRAAQQNLPSILRAE